MSGLAFTRLRRKPRLPVLPSGLLRMVDKAVGLHREAEPCHGSLLWGPSEHRGTAKLVV